MLNKKFILIQELPRRGGYSRGGVHTNSLKNRNKDLIMPVLNGERASNRSQQAFNKIQYKKLVTNSIFSPPTNPAKAKRCQERGRKFDVGCIQKNKQAAKNNTVPDPLLDLMPLVYPEKVVEPEETQTSD